MNDLSDESDPTIEVFNPDVTTVKTSLAATRTSSFHQPTTYPTKIEPFETSSEATDHSSLETDVFGLIVDEELTSNSSSITSGQNLTEFFTKWTSCSLCESLGYINRTRIVCEMNAINSTSNENFSCQVESIEKKSCFNATECSEFNEFQLVLLI